MLPKIEVQITADPTSAISGITKVEKAQSGLQKAQKEYERGLLDVQKAEKSGLVTKEAAAKSILEVEQRFREAAQEAANYVGATATFTRQTDAAAKSLKNAAAAATQNAASSANAAKAVKDVGISAGAAAANTANLAAQFNDIGMMLAAGQSPLMLAVQQGTQVNQVLGQMGTSGRDRLRALATAFTSVVSPANLLTLGVIAGGAALTQWAMSAFNASEEADKLKERMEGARSAVDSLNTELISLRLGVDQTEARMIEEIRATRERIAELEQERSRANPRMMQNYAQQIAAEREVLALQQKLLEEYRKGVDEKERLTSVVEETISAERVLAEALREASREASILADEMAVVRDNSMAAAREFIALQGFRSRFAGEEMVMGQDVLQVGRGQPAPAVSRTRGRSGRRSGGGGGGGASQRQSGLDAFISGLMTERETLEQWRTEQLELLAQYNEAELELIGGHIGAKERIQQEYLERLKGLNQGYYGDTLSQTGAFFGDMASAFQSGNEKMLQISKVFSSAQAVINSYKAFTDVLADGSLPFFAKFAAAAKVLSAGLGAVNAIRGVTSGGGGGSASGAATAGAAGAATAAQQLPRQTAEFRFISGSSGPTNLRTLVDQINQAQDQGYLIRAVLA